MSISSNYPASNPKLLLDFANTKSLDPRITFTRASTATYFDQFGVMQTAASGVPRFDFNPTTLVSLGLLIEEQRTNLQTYSEQFDNAAWTKTNSSITADTIVAPNNTLTGDTFFENTATSTHVITQAFSFVSGTTYTFSIYVKAAQRTALRFLFPAAAFTSNLTANFDISTGAWRTSSPSPSAGLTLSATSVGNGWYRISAAATATASVSTTIFIYLLNSPSGTGNYTGDGTSGIYIWGAQLEAGAFPTSYIPTVASQVTRAADVASMTGANFSSWYNPSESTIYIAFVRFGTTGTPYPIGFTGGSSPTSAPRISLRTDTSMNIQTQGINSLSVAQWSSSSFSGSPGFNVQARAVMAFADNNIGGCVNGNAVTQVSSGIVPTGIDKLFISFQLNGHISKIAYYDTRVSNAQLQGLTS